MKSTLYPFEIQCFVCNKHARSRTDPKRLTLPHSVECDFCGRYEIAGDASVRPRTTPFAQIYLLSSAIRYNSERGRDVIITMANEAEIIASFPQPRNIFEKIDLCLDYLSLPKYAFEENHLFIDPTLISWFSAESGSELGRLRHLMLEIGYCEIAYGDGMHLTADGWKRILSLKEGRSESAQVFVAMWFDPQMDSAWRLGIQGPLTKLNFRPLRIDRKEHNEMIDDQIIAEIRASTALIADFTGERAGVYFEAGFARGLGKPVIWTCRNDYQAKLHFDTRQFNHIIWDSHEDLAFKLTN